MLEKYMIKSIIYDEVMRNKLVALKTEQSNIQQNHCK